MFKIQFCIVYAMFFTLQVLGQNDTITVSPLTGEEREVFIQRALKLRKEESHLLAVNELDSILQRNSVDSGALLFKGDLLLQSKKYRRAAKAYKQLLPLDFEPTITKINLSYALFLSHRPLKALKYAKLAWENDQSNPIAIINYFNAMLWNIKTERAAEFLNQNNKILDDAQKRVMQARLQVTKGDFISGLELYSVLAKRYQNKNFSLEYIEVLISKKCFAKAGDQIRKDSSLFSKSEYDYISNKLQRFELNKVGYQFVFFNDIATNQRIENEVYWQQKEVKKYRFKIGVNSTVIESNKILKTLGNFVKIQCDERWSKTLTGESSFNILQIVPTSQDQSIVVTGSQLVKYQPNDRRMGAIYVSSEILNFTAPLFEKGIRMSKVGYKTHLMLSGKSGFYSEGSSAHLSNDNNRFLFFGSIYHNLRTEPTVKTGLNFSALHFSNSEIVDYFSPNRYFSSEFFVDFTTALPQTSKFYFHLISAAGVQKIETQNWEPAYRIDAEVGTHFKRLDSSIRYQTSNVAAATGQGYQYNWITLNLKVKLY